MQTTLDHCYIRILISLITGVYRRIHLKDNALRNLCAAMATRLTPLDLLLPTVASPSDTITSLALGQFAWTSNNPPCDVG